MPLPTSRNPPRRLRDFLVCWASNVHSRWREWSGGTSLGVTDAGSQDTSYRTRYFPPGRWSRREGLAAGPAGAPSRPLLPVPSWGPGAESPAQLPSSCPHKSIRLGRPRRCGRIVAHSARLWDPAHRSCPRSRPAAALSPRGQKQGGSAAARSRAARHRWSARGWISNLVGPQFASVGWGKSTGLQARNCQQHILEYIIRMNHFWGSMRLCLSSPPKSASMPSCWAGAASWR